MPLSNSSAPADINPFGATWRRRNEELAARKAITSEDLQRATEHAELAHERDQKARDRELYRHYEAGAAHERAADVEELAVREGLGDVSAHQRAAQREREAARRDLAAAQEFDRQDADQPAPDGVRHRWPNGTP
ncbi:MAG TPA: hypothetical protein VMQ38_18450 [Mycobacterium sp.]|nr:hypothetical protein [Mycobacterium sp.]